MGSARGLDRWSKGEPQGVLARPEEPVGACGLFEVPFCLVYRWRSMEIRVTSLVSGAFSDRLLLEVRAYAKRSASGWCDGDRRPGRPVLFGGLLKFTYLG